MGEAEGQEGDGKLCAIQLKTVGSEHKICCRCTQLYTCDILAEPWSSEITSTSRWVGVPGAWCLDVL